MKVLILGVAPVQLDAVVELNKMGCETYAVAMAKDGPAAEVADHFSIINIIDEELIIRHVLDNNIDVVYSTGSDIAMPVACSVSEQLGMPHFVSSDTAYICNHKNVMRSALSDECEGNIPFQVCNCIEPIHIEYPAIMKPSDAQGQRGVFLIHSQEEFEKHFDESIAFSREKKVIVEKYIDGPEISVNGYMVNGVLKIIIVSDRETWHDYTGLVRSHTVPSKIIGAEMQLKIKEVVEDACMRIGLLNGPVYFQMKIMNNKPYIIELTPRLDGCHMWNIIEKAAGVNLMRLVFSHLLFNDISEISKMTKMIRPMELVFWCQKPYSLMEKKQLNLPKDAVCEYYYYDDKDLIRPINGHFEKVGYYMRYI